MSAIEHYLVCDDSGEILRSGYCSIGKALKKTMEPGEHIMLITGPVIHETQLDIKYKVNNPITSPKLVKKEERIGAK